MEHGLRRYEAAQRLVWFLFFLLCLGVAYPAATLYHEAHAEQTAFSLTAQPELLKSVDFWTQPHWTYADSILGFLISILFWVAILFAAGRTLWLVLQAFGKYTLRRLLTEHVGHPKNAARQGSGSSAVPSGRSFPTEVLLRKTSSPVLRLLFHPVKRLRLMLAHPQGVLSAEELSERERRISEMDWHILWESWTPFQWIVRALPVLAFLQASWIFYLYVTPVLSGQKDLHDLLGPVFNSLVPLGQIIVIAVAFNLIAGLLKRIENLYLSSVDALFYDQFLSRLPFQSSDTVILLEALDRHFREVHALLKRLDAVPRGEGER